MDPLRHQLENLNIEVETMEKGMEENMEGVTDQGNSKDSEDASPSLDLNYLAPMDI